MFDRGAPTHDARLLSAAEGAATALASTLGLGADIRLVDEWPLDHGDAVFAADITGGVDGTLFVAINDADRSQSLGAHDVAGAIAATAAALSDALGVPAEVGLPRAVDVVERPAVVAAVVDGSLTSCLVGLTLNLGSEEPTRFDPSQLDAGPAHFEPASFTDEPWSPGTSRDPLSVLGSVEMVVTAELGRTKMPMRELLSLSPGMVVEIDRAAGAPIDLLVNGRRLATGEVVVIDEEFGIRITEIVPIDEPAR